MHSGADRLRGTQADPLRRTDAYRYELPHDLIATVPAEPADASRLLVVGAEGIAHRDFCDFADCLQSGDVLVINETRVIRARLHGRREPGGGRAEIFLLRPASGGAFDPAAREWHALVKPGRKLRSGARVVFGVDAACEVVGIVDRGVRCVRFEAGCDLAHVMAQYGEVPLPPYVGPGDDARAARYQTIFARVPGSVAAPTASLHFTSRTLAAIRARGVTMAPLVLDVGLGTFLPIESATIDEHVMHAERYDIPQATADAVNAAKCAGRRVIATGTTALRALEASAANDGLVHAGAAQTALFITPGYAFRVADALLTNFHLPSSTLLLLVATFGGYERLMDAYRVAIAARYRFFSFGDAMFVTRADRRLVS